jgi:hypothetical protein
VEISWRLRPGRRFLSPMIHRFGAFELDTVPAPR